MKFHFYFKAFFLVTSFIIFSQFSSFAQGPFITGLISQNGKGAIKAGWAGLIEVGGVYTPKSFTKDLSSFIGGSIKIPVWPTRTLNYDGTLFLSYFFTYTGGVIKAPEFDDIIKQTYVSTYAFSPEFIWFNRSIGFAVPLEIGYGRSHLIQDFRNQVSANFPLRKGFFFSTGLKIYLFNNECPYTKGLDIGY